MRRLTIARLPSDCRVGGAAGRLPDLEHGIPDARDALDVLVRLDDGDYRLAVEMRHSDWVTEKNRAATLDYFRTRKLVWVAVDMPRIRGSALMPPIDEATRPDLGYLRLHGQNPNYLKAKSAEERHLHDYTAEELAGIAERAKALATKASEVHVIANNHARDFAPKAAFALKKLLGQPAHKRESQGDLFG